MAPETESATIEHAGEQLHADITYPEGTPRGVVLFAHGSGSSRRSPRNQAVALQLVERGLVSILMDLLTESEDRVDQYTREYRFDISLLASRLVTATDWIAAQPKLKDLPLGYFGASTGAAAALVAAAERPDQITAVVSRGGRPDLAADALGQVRAPTLLIVGGHDEGVIDLNHQAADQMNASVKVEIVPGATHLFEEPGALDTVAELARDWFIQEVDGGQIPS